MVEPALPQFANITDRMTARAVVQNTTAQAGEVIVSLELDEKAKGERGEGGGGGGNPKRQNGLLSPTLSSRGEGEDAATRRLTKTVSVAANGSAVVEFPLEFIETG